MRSLRLPWLWLGLGLALSGYVVFASLTPHPETLPLHYRYKAEHATAYGVLTLWFAVSTIVCAILPWGRCCSLSALPWNSFRPGWGATSR